MRKAFLKIFCTEEKEVRKLDDGALANLQITAECAP